jgi:protein phosphatase
MRRPNAEYLDARPRPLLERNPVAFWRGLAIVLFVLNVALLYFLRR